MININLVLLNLLLIIIKKIQRPFKRIIGINLIGTISAFQTWKMDLVVNIIHSFAKFIFLLLKAPVNVN